MDESGAQNLAGAEASVPTREGVSAQVNLAPEKPEKKSRKKAWIFGLVGGLVVLAGVVTALAILRPWEGGEVAEEVEMTETEIQIAEYKAEIEREIAEYQESLMTVEDSDEEGDVYVLNLDNVDTESGETYRNIIIAAAVGFYNEAIAETAGEVKLGLLEAELSYILESDIDKLFGCQAVNAATAIDEEEQTTESARQVITVATMYGNEEVMQEYMDKLYERQVENGDDLEMETMG